MGVRILTEATRSLQMALRRAHVPQSASLQKVLKAAGNISNFPGRPHPFFSAPSVSLVVDILFCFVLFYGLAKAHHWHQKTQFIFNLKTAMAEANCDPQPTTVPVSCSGFFPGFFRVHSISLRMSSFGTGETSNSVVQTT